MGRAAVKSHATSVKHIKMAKIHETSRGSLQAFLQKNSSTSKNTNNKFVSSTDNIIAVATDDNIVSAHDDNSIVLNTTEDFNKEVIATKRTGSDSKPAETTATHANEVYEQNNILCF